MKLRHGSLESGIGMFDLAAEHSGWENVFHCEISPFCRTILNYYWPKATSYANVFDFPGTDWLGKVDVISAGFPCQPFSNAGKRKGDSDDRFIWKENVRVFREARPRCVVLENVVGLTSILQTEDRTQMEVQAHKLLQKSKKRVEGKHKKRDKMAFEFEATQKRVIAQVIEDLNGIGYETPRLADGTPVILCIPACATGKDHRRDRIWIIAYRDGDGQRNINRPSKDTGAPEENEVEGVQRERLWNQPRGSGSDVTDDKGKQQREQAIGKVRSEHRGDTINVTDDTGAGLSQPRQTRIKEPGKEGEEQLLDGFEQCDSHVANNSRERMEGTEETGNAGSCRAQGQQQLTGHDTKREHWYEAATRLCSLDDGNTRGLDTATISKAKWRNESLKAYGNTIIWEIAHELFSAIEKSIFETLI